MWHLINFLLSGLSFAFPCDRWCRSTALNFDTNQSQLHTICLAHLFENGPNIRRYQKHTTVVFRHHGDPIDEMKTLCRRYRYVFDPNGKRRLKRLKNPKREWSEPVQKLVSDNHKTDSLRMILRWTFTVFWVQHTVGRHSQYRQWVSINWPVRMNQPAAGSVSPRAGLQCAHDVISVATSGWCRFK